MNPDATEAEVNELNQTCNHYRDQLAAREKRMREVAEELKFQAREFRMVRKESWALLMDSLAAKLLKGLGAE